MRNPKHLYNKKQLTNITDKMEADMRLFCRDNCIENKSELVRLAVARYIYADRKNVAPDGLALRQLQKILDGCRLTISINEKTEAT